MPSPWTSAPPSTSSTPSGQVPAALGAVLELLGDAADALQRRRRDVELLVLAALLERGLAGARHLDRVALAAGAADAGRELVDVVEEDVAHRFLAQPGARVAA